MVGTVHLTGGREIQMQANAATPVRYRQVFKKNILTYLTGAATDEESTAMLSELAYIMTRSYEKADMNKLGMDDYIAWLEGFEALDFATESVATEIMAIYQNQKLPESKSKKKTGQQIER